jgi:hypothetical protein
LRSRRKAQHAAPQHHESSVTLKYTTQALLIVQPVFQNAPKLLIYMSCNRLPSVTEKDPEKIWRNAQKILDLGRRKIHNLPNLSD